MISITYIVIIIGEICGFFANFAHVINRYRNRLSIVDIIIIILLIAGIIIGSKNGIVRQISSLGAIFLGIILCRTFGDYATQTLIRLIPETKALPFFETTSSILANIALFLLVYLTVMLTGTMLKSAIHSIKLGVMDRILGAIFSVFKFFIGISLALNLWFIVSPKSTIFTSSKILDGALFRFIQDLAPWLFNSKIIPTATDTIEKIIT